MSLMLLLLRQRQRALLLMLLLPLALVCFGSRPVLRRLLGVGGPLGGLRRNTHTRHTHTRICFCESHSSARTRQPAR